MLFPNNTFKFSLIVSSSNISNALDFNNSIALLFPSSSASIDSSLILNIIAFPSTGIISPSIDATIPRFLSFLLL